MHQEQSTGLHPMVILELKNRLSFYFQGDFAFIHDASEVKYAYYTTCPFLEVIPTINMIIFTPLQPSSCKAVETYLLLL